MGLHWNFTRGLPTENYPEPEDRMNPVTETLIWATMAIDIGTLDESTAAEFYARIHLYEVLNGAFLQGPDGPTFLTPADIQAHLGLQTNVTHVPSRTVWMKRIVERPMADYERVYYGETGAERPAPKTRKKATAR